MGAGESVEDGQMPMKLAVRLFETAVTVILDDSLPEQVRDAILGQWAHLQISHGNPEPRFRLTLTADATERESHEQIVLATGESAADQLATSLTLVGLRSLIGKAFLFHAAGLALDDGRVLAFVGPSGRGKTTVATRLGTTLGYVSDETVAFRHDLSVIPYPKPLSIGSRPGSKHMHAPSALGLKPAPDELRLAALVLLDRDPCVRAPRVESVPLDEALGELVPQMSSLAAMPDPLRNLVDVIAKTGGVRRLVYAGAEELADLVPTILQTRSHTQLGRKPATREPSSELPQGAVGRAPFVDALTIDDKLAVLSSHRLHVLAGIGPTLWNGADGVSIGELLALVESVHGPNPNGAGSSYVAEVFDQLVEAGVLQVG
jgi:hypothetical protein